ncbi:MAG: M23 family metallopeptidase [Desulfatiglandales bacterium]|nr:M23 family metallopeptidase [Desulfatiglandales bacterium]
MRKTISLLILNNTGTPIKQISAAKSFIWFCGLLLFASFVFAGLIAFDYSHLIGSVSHSRYLKTQVADYLDTIQNQRSHIQGLAGEINELKSKLVALNGFEEKVRIIANIKEASEQRSLFGIGGNIPDDLHTNISLSTDHSSLVRDMHEQAEQLDLAATSQEQGFETLIHYLQDQQNILTSTPAIQPTNGWITSGFGYRTSPFTGKRVFHKAVDIATREGTPVVATADGVITFAGRKGLLGRVITIDHGYGMITRYGHLKKILKRRGETIKRGDPIALVGMTGRTTGPHLHYEVQLNGVPVNPKKYILN